MDNKDEPTYYYAIRDDVENNTFVSLRDILNPVGSATRGLEIHPSLSYRYSTSEESSIVVENDENNTNDKVLYVAIDSDSSIFNDQINGLSNSDNGGVLFRTALNEDEDSSCDNSFMVSEDIPNGVEIDKNQMSNLKLVTLEDGRMFVTTADINVQGPVGSCEAAEESNSDDLQLIELADGTHALIKMFNSNLDSNCGGTEEKSDDLVVATTEKSEEEDVDEEEVPKKRFRCTFEGCEKLYGSSYHLSVHMRSHFDLKPYECTIAGCDKRFTTNYSLKAHTRTHTGEKPYGCNMCTKQFKTSGDLHKHVRIHTGVKPFLCPIEGCGRSFTTSNIRKVHVRSHTGERPYVCQYPNCCKAFTSSTNYKNHVRIHSGEKPYLCSFEGCGKRFTEYSSLYKHNSVHQLDRPYACSFCNMRFKQEVNLNVHKRLKHDVVVTKDGTEFIVKIE